MIRIKLANIQTWLSGSLKRTIDILPVKILGKAFNIRDTIMISGTPRGGTTWIMEILATLPNYKYIYEPSSWKRFPRAAKLKIPPRPYIPPGEDWPQLKKYLYDVFTGREVGAYPTFNLNFENIANRIKASKLIVKFIRTNRLIPWIYKNFELRGIYLIMRHPCATIASQLQTKYTGYPTLDPNLLKKYIINELLNIREINNKDILIRKIKSLEKIEEILAVIWCLDYYIPLFYLHAYPASFYLIVYEKLVVDFDSEIRKVFGYIKEKVPNKAYKLYKKPSFSAYSTRYIGTTKQLTKWKKYLSNEQINRILSIVSLFGLDFYTDEPEPNYRVLKNWKPLL